MAIVRLSLPVMLTVSVALHGGLMGGYFLNQLHWNSKATPNQADQTETMILLTSEETPDFRPVAVQAKPAASQAVEKSLTGVQVASTKMAAGSISTAATARPPSLALEANPNAHIRELPPESVLSPVPAPRLDAHAGVVFVLDISGSMYEKCETGSTRLAMAREVLSQRISALKDGTPFAITVYALRARNSGPLVPANAATREAAVRFIQEDIDCGGGTDLSAGLASAMKLGEGNLMLLSDGDLNTTLVDLTTKAKAILLPEKEGPSVTVIGIAPRRNTGAAALLKSVANLTGGTFVTVEYAEQAALLTETKGE